VEGLPGNAGVFFLVDREAGTGLTLTLWDTAESAEATDRFAEQSRATAVEATGTELMSRGSFEVVAQGSPGRQPTRIPGPARGRHGQQTATKPLTFPVLRVLETCRGERTSGAADPAAGLGATGRAAGRLTG